MTLPKAFLSLLLLLVTVFAGGCAYRLGTAAPLSFSRIYIPPVVNRSLAPQAQALLTQQLAEKLSQHPELSVVRSDAGAEVVLEVVLVDYSRTQAIRSSDDTQLPRSMTLQMTAEVTLRRKGGDGRDAPALFKDRRVTVTEDAWQSGDYLNAEYAAMAPLCLKLAEKIRNEVVSAW